MQLKLIPAGEFVMGSPAAERGARDNERPQHLVQMTKPYYLGIYEVTQEEYERVNGDNPSYFKGHEKRPVESVSWYDAVNFCSRLSEQEGLEKYYQIDGRAVSILGGSGYRLPTEAEWEYACRAGTITRWSCGDRVDELAAAAWFANSRPPLRTHPVGKKAPNPWGLYDMHGNVWEWCWDGYGRYESSELAAAKRPATGDVRVLRGGSFGYRAIDCRSAIRFRLEPGLRYSGVGFRVSRTCA